ncbi:AraC family transcriptional regulator [Lacticaseibacillus pantheris]|uniref:AraC family transcriptional regulator n=1 Tax=Lacticaseibacillus pantheris TaxID=171523 RepID=UPI00265A6BAC|nr:AraC family transcriptional regulator [Lacticaseibacillus pantheris]WKF83986.1 AraC family transcriptional regulator [Lacticaseibacillus pantheris]
MNPGLLMRLQQLSSVEKKQLKSQSLNDDIPPAALDLAGMHRLNRPVFNNYFFNNRDVFVSKHNRFAPYPLHSHHFLEINYVLSGEIHEIVNGDPVTLKKDDLLLLDVGSSHSIAAPGKDDIMMNILFRDNNISINLLNQIQSKQSELYNFLINSVLKPQQASGQYLLFPKERGNDDVKLTVDRLIEEYYSHRSFADTIIQAYLNILIAKLVRNYRIPSAPTTPAQKLAIKTLQEIHSNYQDISLADIAKKYSYNANYLGNQFHKETGKTFSQALTSERLIHARELVSSTQLPINDIMRAVGISNSSFFYHKYKEQYGCLPREDRASSYHQLTSILSDELD